MSRREFLPCASLALLALLTGCAQRANSLIVYCAQDQLFAEPLLQEFGATSDFQVRTVFDSEAVKTVGLANRLVAEKRNPQASLFWNNEPLRTFQLVNSEALEPDVALFGYRSRRMVINTERISESDAPRDWLDLIHPKWRGKIAMAYPLFGATATHFAALRQALGAREWSSWCKALALNKPMLVDGNSVVVRLVGAGEALIGLTDSDDIAVGQRQGLPIGPLKLSDHSLLLPNSIGRVRNAPAPQFAERLAAHLQSAAVVKRLVEAGALEGADASEITVSMLEPDWPDVAAQLPQAMAELQQIFLR